MRIGILILLCSINVDIPDRAGTVAAVHEDGTIDAVMHEDTAADGTILPGELLSGVSSEPGLDPWYYREFTEADCESYESAAEDAYNAYTKSSGGKNYRGDPCPAWSELPDAIRGHWTAAVRAVLGIDGGRPPLPASPAPQASAEA